SADENRVLAALDARKDDFGSAVFSIATQDAAHYLAALAQRVGQELLDQRLVVRVRTGATSSVDADLSSVDLLENPVEVSYSTIRPPQLRPVSYSDIREQDLNDFFSGSESWKGFAAGLPWIRQKEVVTKTIDC